MIDNNTIVSTLAVSKVVEYYADVLGSDIPLQERQDIVQDTYLELLENKRLKGIYRRGKLRDYVFAIVRNKVAHYYADKEYTILYEDYEEQHSRAFTQRTLGWE